jgi:CBS domain-containing protein
MLAEKKIGAAVVLDDGEVCGIASERDVVREIAAHGGEALSKPVSVCMTRKVISAHPDDSVESVMSKMTKGRFRHMPVTEKGKLVGIVSISDIVKRKIEQAEREAEEMKRYIAG